MIHAFFKKLLFSIATLCLAYTHTNMAAEQTTPPEKTKSKIIKKKLLTKKAVLKKDTTKKASAVKKSTKKKTPTKKKVVVKKAITPKTVKKISASSAQPITTSKAAKKPAAKKVTTQTLQQRVQKSLNLRLRWLKKQETDVMQKIAIVNSLNDATSKKKINYEFAKAKGLITTKIAKIDKALTAPNITQAKKDSLTKQKNSLIKQQTNLNNVKDQTQWYLKKMLPVAKKKVVKKKAKPAVKAVKKTSAKPTPKTKILKQEAITPEPTEEPTVETTKPTEAMAPETFE